MSLSSYMLVLVFSAAIPFVLSFFPPLAFYRNWRALIATLALISFLFGVWDIFATYRGHWYFNPAAVYSVRIINLPLEELLFFVVIPFCCIFTWETLHYLRKKLQ